MKHWGVAFLLLAIVMPASAGWTFVDESTDVERYLNEEHIDRDGDRVRVWEIDNHALADASGVVSLRSQTEYDCGARRYRIVHLSGHTQPMTEGAVVFSKAVDGEWRPVAPQSLGEASMEIACAN